MNTLLICMGLIASGWLSWFGTKRFLMLAMERKLIDVPNFRSSHNIPTPRGAGIVFASVFLGGIASLAVLHLLRPFEAVSLFAGALVAAVGFWDDCRGLPIMGRFVTQLLVSTVAILCVLKMLWTQEWVHHRLLPLLIVILILAFVWLINLTNFMDGIDGIATTEIICVATGCSLIITLQHRFDEIVLSFILLAVSAVGFLFWNWPPARVFMGDAGSCFLGYSLGALILIAIARGSLSLVVPLILLAVFIIDATLTLIKRFARGEKWYMPHRAHAFQHAAKRFGHLKTTLAVAGINILWLTPLAILAQRRPGESWLVLIIAWFPVVVLAQLLHVGEHREIAEGELFYKFFNGETSLKTWKMLSLWRDRSALPRPFIVVRLTKIVILAEISLLSIYLAFLSQSPVSIMAGRRLFSLEVLIWAGVQCMVLMLFKMDRSHWRLLSIEEIPTIGGMSLVASLIGALSAFVVSPRTTNKTQQHFVLLECLFFVLLTVGLQVAVSLIRSVQHSRGDRGCKRRVLIFSADQTGADILASLRRMCPECDPLGFVDAREETRGTYLSGLPVLGGTHDIFNIADTYNVRELLISSVHVGSSSALGLVQLCRVSGINFTVVHSIRQDIQSPELAISGNSDVTLTIGFPDMSGVGRGITSWAANE